MTHRDLEVYKLSLKLVADIYKLTSIFPKFEVFGLGSQMQRAAVSIPSNIAEGASRRGTKEYIHFLSTSTGSASELETQLNIVVMLGYCDDNERIATLLNSVDKVRYLLIQTMKALERKLDKN